jgi:3-deoxy-manno-octulosonate cytidylyltransferase (CMP-KDO synthetase)
VRRLAVIPARLGSKRLPHKALLHESGHFLFEHVAERASRARSFDAVVVATDAQEILEAARSVGLEARLTSSAHVSGTDRVGEVARAFPSAQIVVNVQGDEPEVEPRDLDRLVEALETEGTDVATLATPFGDGEDPQDPDSVKVVRAGDGRALYFSRAPVPYLRGRGERLRHIGIYAFRRRALEDFLSLPPSPLEAAEGLEQLRLLEAGRRIDVLLTSSRARGIDTREEYDRFLARWRAGDGAWRSTSS